VRGSDPFYTNPGTGRVLNVQPEANGKAKTDQVKHLPFRIDEDGRVLEVEG